MRILMFEWFDGKMLKRFAGESIGRIAPMI